jgi:chromosomal replication initiation ATPase DnaA
MELNKIQAEAFPAIVKILTDTEEVLHTLTGVNIKLYMRVKDETHSVNEAAWLRVQEAVCNATGLKWSDIVSKSRRGDIVNARKLFIYFSRQKMPYLSLSKLGKMLGGKDHSSILQQYKKFEEFIEVGDAQATTHFAKVCELLKTP